jgi:hypothetical protein
MKQADRSRARYAVILEAGAQPQLREMEGGDQREIEAAAIAAEVKR